MTIAPTSIPTGNSHRAVLFQPDRRGPDFERLEDIAADAFGHARAGLQALHALPFDLFAAVRRDAEHLAPAIDDRRILTDRFRDGCEGVLHGLARLDVPEAEAACMDAVMRNLRDALEAAHRVADLLHAEREIGRFRGL